MAFRIPPGEEGFFKRVIVRFRTLISCGVIDVVTITDLDRWLTNFETDEERYFAAHLLNAATVRSLAMVESALQTVAEVIVPQHMREIGRWDHPSIESFERRLAAQAIIESIRFMPVDGMKLDKQAGNSGDATARAFRLATTVNERYLIRADDTDAWRGRRRIGLLVLLDDVVGSGKQFSSFVRAYDLASYAAENACVYVPLLACRSGVEHLHETCPGIPVRPVEVLEESARFFSSVADDGALWARDERNTCTDARDFYDAMMTRTGAGRESQHGLDLTLLLHHRTPNNALRAIWSNEGRWRALKRR